MTRGRFMRSILTTGFVFSGILFVASVSAQGALLLRFDSDNYNSATSTWSDTSGNGDNAVVSGGLAPSFKPNATPTGKGAVTFTQSSLQYLDLQTHIDTAAFTSAPSFTFLFVGRVDGGTVIAGRGDSFRGGVGWRFDSEGTSTRQMLTKLDIEDVGFSSILASKSAFHLFAVTYDGTTANFYLDGQSAGSVTHSLTFGTGLYHLGTQAGTGSASFVGDMAALRAYDTVLTPAELATATLEMTSTYLVPEPTSAMTLVGAGALLLGLARRSGRRSEA